MKKALFIFLLLAGFTAVAQVRVMPGIRAGASISTLTQTDLDYKTDFYVGTFAAIKLSRFYVLQPEVNYSRQGASGRQYYNYYYYDGNYSGDGHIDDMSLQYLSFSIINRFTLSDRIDVHVGPTLDFLLNNTYQSIDTDADTGITAGIGYTLPFGLTIEARVKKGFVDILTDYYDGQGNYYDDYNTNFSFQVGVSYNFTVSGRKN
ncbi:outer membrane beta-barrel protein [Flavobacterium rhizosphaerae]|uniref:Outer membrane beta-barrel protein n=1 Tax=Flavobacterium rhizosphaerae TaxID=3163298 RepID=A0ABW8Z008_9FLAO